MVFSTPAAQKMDVPNAGAMVANISKLIPRSDDEDGADRAFDEDNMVLQVVPVAYAACSRRAPRCSTRVRRRGRRRGEAPLRAARGATLLEVGVGIDEVRHHTAPTSASTS